MLAAALLFALWPSRSPVLWQVAAGCAANSRDHLTPAFRGPQGSLYQFGVRTDDDHGRNTHLCLSEYFSRSSAALPGARVRELDGVGVSAEATWSRDIRLSLAGFSADGRWVLGVSCETGAGAHNGSNLTLLAVSLTTGGTGSLNLTALTGGGGRGCPTDVSVEGFTDDQHVVLRGGLPSRRWIGRLSEDGSDSPVRPWRGSSHDAGVTPLTVPAPEPGPAVRDR